MLPGTWTCACCGLEFRELPHLVFAAPIDWQKLSWFEKLRSRLDTDFCLVRYSNGEVVRLIRCVLPIPVPELDREICFGVWMSVSEESWKVYERGFETGIYERSSCFSYLMHDIPDFEGSQNLPCELLFQPDRQRPRVLVLEHERSLYLAQRHGVPESQVDAWMRRLHTPPP